MSTVVAGANRDLLLNAFKDVEEIFNCKVLHWAVVGSRRWGFQSPDSDFDINFVYTYPEERHLALEGLPNKNLIFKRGNFEFQGWELREWLTHLRKSKAYPSEHLFTQVEGAASFTVNTDLRIAFQQDHFNVFRFWHDHASVARKEVHTADKAGKVPAFKEQLYALRSLAMMRWLKTQAGAWLGPSAPESHLLHLLSNHNQYDLLPDAFTARIQRMMIARNKGLEHEESVDPQFWADVKAMILLESELPPPKPEKNYFGIPVRFNAIMLNLVRDHAPRYDYRVLEGGLDLINRRTEEGGFNV